MPEDHTVAIRRVVEQFGRDRYRLMPILQAVQFHNGYISDEGINEIAAALGIRRVEVEDTVSFYSFFRREPGGATIIRFSKCPMCAAPLGDKIVRAFEKALGIKTGETTADGKVALQWTNCIGMCDQGPAALINGTVFTRISPADVTGIVQRLTGKDPVMLPDFPGPDGATGFFLGARVSSSLRQPGPVLFNPMTRGSGLWASLTKTPEKVIEEVAKSRLRGRGGAGFPTANKWKFARNSRAGNVRYVICNADEGEPGTFKDRVLLTEMPDLVFEGMTIAAYVLGAKEGLVYLRAEYAYLWDHLQKVLAHRRSLGLLGDHICGKEGFDFDIQIRLGAGAYVCGEESALIESLEGKRGAPRDRPPFPADRGYMAQPTTVNNVESYACITRILERGGEWFGQYGTRESTGTKLLSVSGDCERPGVYEVPFGVTVNDLLDLVGGGDAQAVQVGGPSGQCVAPKDYGRQICYEDLSTGGSIMVFGPQRHMLDVVLNFQEFFAEESCGWCAPCRVGTTLLKLKLEKILHDRGTEQDWQELLRVGRTVQRMSRCGLGQSAANPILSTSRNFPELYEARLKGESFIPVVTLDEALAEAERVQGRQSVAHEE